MRENVRIPASPTHDGIRDELMRLRWEDIHMKAENSLNRLRALLDDLIPPDQVATVPPIEEYRLLNQLGRGAMGRVFLAEDTLLCRTVALKFPLRLETVPHAKERFLNEARAIARLSHPNVVAIHRVADVGGILFIVSEYIRGQTLDRLPKPLAWTQVLQIGLDLARGLAAAHRNGVLHRDIKPGNAIQADDGTVKLLDFGLARVDTRQAAPGAGLAGEEQKGGVTPGSPQSAPPILPKNLALAETVDAPGAATGPDPARSQQENRAQGLTETGAVIGTPLYMAPEQWRGEPPTAQTDLYALGALLFELCTGVPPHSADTVEDLCILAQERDPPLLAQAVPSINTRFAKAVDRCLRRDPAERYASTEELVFALEEIHRQATESAPAVERPYRGLFPFDVEHSGLFFGRSREISEILERLRVETTVLVAGDSGVGKSSLCRAGVLAQARAGALKTGLSVQSIVLFPGPHPLVALADALAEPLSCPSLRLLTELRQIPMSFVRRLHRHAQEAGGLILFIDQLEELVTQSEPSEARLIGEMLSQLCVPCVTGLRVLLSARGDLLTRLAELPGLGAVLSRALYLLGPLGREHLRQAIVQPALAAGVKFESEILVEELIESTLRAQGGLPLLQFALAELWEQRDVQREMITAKALGAIGGVDGALAQHADRVLNSLLSAQRESAKQLLVSLVTVSGLRIRKTVTELAAKQEDRVVLESLVRARLLVARESGEQTSYEIAHEALVQGWETLRHWLESEEDQRAARERLEAATAEWLRLRQTPETLWGRPQLNEFKSAQLAEGQLPPEARDFLRASRGKVRRQRWTVAGLLMSVPALLLGGYGVTQVRAGQERRARVSEHVRAAQASLTNARGLVAQSLPLQQQAIAAFDAHQDKNAERLWTESQSHVPESQRLYERATQDLERAVAVDSHRSDVRAQLAAVLFERAIRAEQQHDPQQLQELLERLAVHDATGEHQRRWKTPAHVRITTQPAGVHVTMATYREGENKRRILGEPRALGVTPLDTEIDPGSQLIVLSAPEVETVRYPVLVERGEGLDLKMNIPRTGSLPKDFVYIPPGRFLSGSTGDEVRKNLYSTWPLHAMKTGGYLISRYEVTLRQWLDYVSELPEEEQKKLAAPAESGKDNPPRARRLPNGSWEVTFKTYGGLVTVRSGERLVIKGRPSRQEQDWLQLPVSNLNVPDGQSYMGWLRRSGRVPGARFCTELEWERAARGADARLFPHGDELAPQDANFDLTYGQTAGSAGLDEVGSYPVSMSPFGIFDLAGNALEWTVRAEDPLSAIGRGGAYFLNKTSITSVNRIILDPKFRDPQSGLRVCADDPSTPG